MIIVATRNDLINCAARAATSGLTEAAKTLSPIIFATGTVAGLLSAGTIIYKPSFRGKNDQELLERLEDELRLGTPLTLFSPTDAIRFFKFGVGHTPQGGCVYVQHPILDDTYIAPEEFARTLAREKEAAFRQLASALGAKELRLVNAKINSKKGWFGTSLSISEAAAQVGIKAHFDSKGSFVRSVYSKYGPPRSLPRVPSDLQEWVKNDADLRTMARERIEGHLLHHQLTLEFKEGLGANAEVAAKLAGRGMTAGGSYESLYHSFWHFEAEYWPLDSIAT